MTTAARRELWISVAIVVCALTYYLAFFNFGINPSDEGYLCYGTHRVLQGQVPGADFHAYEPGRYWVLAPFFHLFGADVVVERAVLLCLRVLICLIAYRAARLYLPISLALIAAAPTVLVPGPWHKSWFPLLMLIGFLLAHRLARRPGRWLAFAGGLIVGIGAVFRLDIGLFTGVLVTASLVTVARTHPGGPRTFMGLIPWFIGGVLSPVTAACTALALQGRLLPALTFFVNEYVNASGTLERIHPKIAGFPSFTACLRQFPHDLFELMIWLSMGSAVLLVTVAAVRWRRERSAPLALLLLCLAWACTFVGVLFQPDRSHLLQNGPLLWITIVTSLYLAEGVFRSWREPGRSRSTRPWPSALLAALATGGLIVDNLFGAGINSYYTGSIRMRFGPHEPSGFNHATLSIDPWIAEEYRGILEFIKTRSRPGDGLATCFCLPMFNFMSERENPTGLDILFPHTIGRPDQQQRYLDALAGVRLLLVNTCEFSHRRPQHCPPNDHTLEDFAPAVVTHIEEEWRPAYTSMYGFVTIYARRSDTLEID